MATSQAIYLPIKPYQTRIMILHGDQNDPRSPLVCDLRTADILHPKFHLGVRTSKSDNDYNVPYDALSYSWGGEDTSRSITCNDVELPTTNNLFQALKALRYIGEKKRHLWVDAICINQKDNEEKAFQVWNMFMIYQGAGRVLAWLGTAPEETEQALTVLKQKKPLLEIESNTAFWNVTTILRDLYKRPWFRRLWVQQEVYAAQELKLQWGFHGFTWAELQPSSRMLNGLSDMEQQVKSTWTGNFTKKPNLNIPDPLTRRTAAIKELELCAARLFPIERFVDNKDPELDFIECLLDTGMLAATNPRDYIFGIVGMANYPAKPMSTEQWKKKRQCETFIPIDYEANLESILCATTWTMIMTGGLTILAIFKAFHSGRRQDFAPQLPSWVIDWSFAAKSFTRSLDYGSKRNNGLRNAWCVGRYSYGRVEITTVPSPKKKIPAEHQQLCKDNQLSDAPLTKLLVRGAIDRRYYARDKSI